MKKGTFVVLTLMLMVGPGLAQRSRTIHTIDLTPTIYGQAVDLSAQANKSAITARRNGSAVSVEVFSVHVHATMEDEEVFEVLIDTTSGQTDLPVGTISLSSSFGHLVLLSRKALFGGGLDQPGDLPVPLSEIQTVKLAYQGNILTVGSFNDKFDPVYRGELQGIPDPSQTQGAEADAVSSATPCQDACRQQLIADREHCATLQRPANYSCWLRAQQDYLRCLVQCRRQP